MEIQSNYPKVNRIIAGLLFLVSLVIYVATMAPTVSFWDCGEFIATSYIMGVSHPPGSPLYLLVGRIASMLPVFDDIGARVNLLSPITSALAVMFLYLSIVHLIRKFRGEPKDSTDALIAFGSSAIAALTFMVTDSHWFNAVEAEVYSVSTFLTAFVVWLILRWSQKDDASSHAHYIIILFYIFGLATGIHLLNILALPFVALVIYFRHYEFAWPGFLSTTAITGATVYIIYIVVIKGLPRMAAVNGYFPIIFVLTVLAVTVWAIQRKMHNTSVVMASLVMVLIGYSTYATIFIRSAKDPAIDENNPENVERVVAYMERQQYGDWSIMDRARWTPKTKNRYTGVGDFFWNYQVKKMYLRYFLWQYAGRGPSTDKGVSPFGATYMEDGVDWFRFGLPLGLLIGLFGMGYQLQKDWKHGMAVGALFLATGIMVIIYLNQPDPQPRERDYSYVGSFLVWSIWIGIGIAGILEYLSKKIKDLRIRQAALPATLAILLAVMPGVMLATNYHEHDRSGNYVAWDYSYNMLNSCKPNGILFTNGDNDTFPLWYLQEVEGIRKDVRIVNLSLVNTDWYITQLRDHEPKIPLDLSDRDIKQMLPIPWETREVKLAYNHPEIGPGTLEWTMKPTFSGRYLRTQDRMVVQIIKDVEWERPVYIAVTVAPENRIGLEKYLEMQGLVYELMPQRTKPVNLEMLHHNLLEVYRYRNLDDPTIHYNNNIRRLLQNLRASYLQLALDGIIKGDRELARMYLDTLQANIPEATVPVSNRELYMQISQLYSEVGDTAEVARRLDEFPNRFRVRQQDQVRLAAMYGQGLGDWDRAEQMLNEVYRRNPTDGELVGNIIALYRSAGHDDKVIPILEEWLIKYPNDNSAKQLYEALTAK